MKLRSILGQAIDLTIKRRVIGSAQIYDLASRIVRAYENQDLMMGTNGEYWLQARVGEFGPITAFDVGANIGKWVNGLLERSHDCTVYCYEPIPATYERLKEKVSDPRTVLINKACSSEAGVLLIYSAPDLPEVSSVEDIRKWDNDTRVEQIEVSSVTGDEELKRLSIDHLDLLKIDAEGHDFAVLLGFKRANKEQRIGIIQFEYNTFTRIAKRSLADFFQLLSDGYVICRLLPAGLEVSGYHSALDNYHTANFVAVNKALVTLDFVKRSAMRPARGLAGAALSRSLDGEPQLCKALGLSKVGNAR